MPSIAGTTNSAALKINNESPTQTGGSCTSPLPASSLAFSARAGASAAACRAGNQAPTKPAAMPSETKNKMMPACHSASGATPAKNPLPKSAPNFLRANVAIVRPSSVPRTPPIAPSSAPSVTNARINSRRVTPSVRYSANCVRRRTTESDCVENTKKPPVNSATSDNTVRLIR